MKSYLRLIPILVMCLLLTTSAAAQVAQPTQTPISVAVSPPTLSVKVGSDCKLDVVVTNTSDARVDLSNGPGMSSLDVRDYEGKAVREVNAIRDQVAAKHGVYQAGGSYQGLKLAPHQVFRYQEIVNREFDLSKPGKYTVQAMRWVGNTPVKSNTITITVVP